MADTMSDFRVHISDDTLNVRKIDIDLLQLDLSYHREPEGWFVDRIASEWSWLTCGVLLVAERDDGSLYVVDGGYRLYAARLRGDIKALLCQVYKPSGPAQEADDFISINTVRDESRFPPLEPPPIQ